MQAVLVYFHLSAYQESCLAKGLPSVGQDRLLPSAGWDFGFKNWIYQLEFPYSFNVICCILHLVMGWYLVLPVLWKLHIKVRVITNTITINCVWIKFVYPKLLHKVSKNCTVRLRTSRMNFGVEGKKSGSYQEKGNEPL